MFDFVFSSVYGASDSVASSISSIQFLECCLASIVFGLIVALVYMFKHTYKKNFVVTLALMPLIVQMVITLVNGNLGAGIAVMGVFNLVRFRSIPGTAKDICSVFFAMATGLATGMGFIALGAIFAVVTAIINIVFVLSPLGKAKQEVKTLKVSVPEDLEFDGMFDEVLKKYSSDFSLEEVRTTNMGSLFRLTYRIKLDNKKIKALIDELRTLNGNLKISIGNAITFENSL